MRLFVNAVFDLKTKYGDIASNVLAFMEKNNWENERALFYLDDSANDAKTESRTPHAMLCKAFPQLIPYWHNYDAYFREYGEVIGSTSIKPAMFCNYPGIVNGEIQYMPKDEKINNDLLVQIAGKIPRPYSFFGAIIAFDGIGWYGDSNTTPIFEWKETEFYPNGNILPGYIWNTYLIAPWFFYQSNGVFLSKAFDERPEMSVRIELTETHDREDAWGIIRKFEEVFGKVTKVYTVAVPDADAKEDIKLRYQKMQKEFNVWCKNTLADCKNYIKPYIEKAQLGDEKEISQDAKQKRFIKETGLKRHDIRRWDDYGWYKRMPYNYWIYVEIMDFSRNRLKNRYIMRIHCHGSNFNMCDEVNLQSFVDEENEITVKAMYEGFSYYFKRFEEEVIPMLEKNFGETHQAFYQESYEFDWYWYQSIMSAWMDEKRRNNLPMIY